MLNLFKIHNTDIISKLSKTATFDNMLNNAIICKETDEIFGSIKELAKSLNKSKGAISNQFKAYG